MCINVEQQNAFLSLLEYMSYLHHKHFVERLIVSQLGFLRS